MSKKALSDQVLIGYSRSSVVVIKGTIKEPITKMKAFVPKGIRAVAFHEIDPPFHADILILQNALVAVSQIHVPRNDGSRIGPTCRDSRPLTQHVGYDKGHASIDLIGRYIFQPFGKEIIHTKIVRGRP